MKSEKRNPIHLMLKIPRLYSWVQNLLATKSAYNIVYKDIICCKDGQKILDLGCGPALNRHLLGSNIQYTGVDFNLQHILEAKSKYPRDCFVHTDLIDFLKQDTHQYHKILLIGVLHHLDDKTASGVLSLVSQRLLPDGNMVAIDPLLEKGQHWVARLLARLDQGSFVRFADQYKALMSESKQKQVNILIRRDLLRVPYSHHIMIW